MIFVHIFTIVASVISAIFLVLLMGLELAMKTELVDNRTIIEQEEE